MYYIIEILLNKRVAIPCLGIPGLVLIIHSIYFAVTGETISTSVTVVIFLLNTVYLNYACMKLLDASIKTSITLYLLFCIAMGTYFYIVNVYMPDYMPDYATASASEKQIGLIIIMLI